jgi:hypothetical protein
VWAFSDESERANRMILVVATVPPSAVHAARAHLRALLLPGQRRIHTSDESPRRRRVILDAVAHVEDVNAVAFCYRRGMGVTHVEARRTLLMAATQHVVANGASSWILDNQDPQQRARDRATITGVFRGVTDTSHPVFDHRRGSGGERYSRRSLSVVGGLAQGVLFGLGLGCGQTVERPEDAAQRPTSSRPLDNRCDEADVAVPSRFRVQSDEGSIINRLEGCRIDGRAECGFADIHHSTWSLEHPARGSHLDSAPLNLVDLDAGVTAIGQRHDVAVLHSPGTQREEVRIVCEEVEHVLR